MSRWNQGYDQLGIWLDEGGKEYAQNLREGGENSSKMPTWKTEKEVGG
jgi:hypothetical protein